jgi:hypothetical protein
MIGVVGILRQPLSQGHRSRIQQMTDDPHSYLNNTRHFHLELMTHVSFYPLPSHLIAFILLFYVSNIAPLLLLLIDIDRVIFGVPSDYVLLYVSRTMSM